MGPLSPQSLKVTHIHSPHAIFSFPKLYSLKVLIMLICVYYIQGQSKF